MPHLELMPDVSTLRVVGNGAVWLVMVAAWMRACTWIERDARDAFSSAMPWSLLLAVCGLHLLVLPLLFGLARPSTFLIVPGLVIAAYLWKRDTRRAPEERVLVSPRMQRLLYGGVHSGPLREVIDRARKLRRKDPGEAVKVTLQDKSGEPAVAPLSWRQRRTVDRAVDESQEVFARAFAYHSRAIHLEPRPDGQLRVLYQIDGVMKPMQLMPRARGVALTKAIKILGGMDVGDVVRPQEGTFAIASTEDKRDVRASARFTAFGEALSLQIRGEPLAGGLYRDGLSAIGMPWRVCDGMRTLLGQRRGMILIGGPQHSGRTTTAYAAIGEIDPLNHSVATIEDPIEERLPFAVQSPVDAEADRTFPKVLRAVLWQNPDVVFVGDLRDRETAEIAIEAAKSRLIIAVVRADDAASSLVKLLGLGLDPAFLQEAVAAVLAQRLARRLCTACKKPYPPPVNFRKKLRRSPTADITIFRRKSCEACHRTGYSGVVPITELLLMNDAVRDMLGRRPTPRRLRSRARKAGMQTLRESAIQLVQGGVTSIREVVRVVP